MLMKDKKRQRKKRRTNTEKTRGEESESTTTNECGENDSSRWQQHATIILRKRLKPTETQG